MNIELPIEGPSTVITRLSIELLEGRSALYNKLYDEVHALEGEEREEGEAFLHEQATELEALIRAMYNKSVISLADCYEYLAYTTSRDKALFKRG